ncbi:MAG: sigma-54-dependent Fis family transcriptional regulator [Bacteroidales bacterium]|nr:sigma-54-dependent Fis family transcriptional regulator [Bacteroidales bacterium]
MRKTKIFVVEDDPMFSRLIAYHLTQNPDNEVITFNSGKDFLMALSSGNPDIVTLDYSLPDSSGLEILAKIQEYNPDLPVVIISGQENISTVVELLKHGARDYIVKDNEIKNRIWNTIKNIKENLTLRDEIRTLRAEIGKKYEFTKSIIGNSSSIKQVFSLMEKAVKTNITVSITGETGTGKEVVAKAIHYNSSRSKKPFVTINVSAVPEELIESEMFGHEKGAFTGAQAMRIGKFEEADKGTLFLDEIGEMSLSMQAKLLRAIQEREFSRVGGNAVIKTDVRIIVATHRNLTEEVSKGNFREDLYYRLLGLPIVLPPLRDRESDIILLAKHFINQFCQENGMEKLNLSKDAQEKLLKYPYPGNVRELKAIIELAAVMANTNTIEAADINFQRSSSMNDLMMEELTLNEYNKRIINSFLKKYDDNILLVAKKLDIGKSTIYRMKKNGEL